MNQAAQGHQPGPSGLPIEENVRAAFMSGGFVQKLVQCPHAIRLRINRIVDGQQSSRFGKQADDQPHHDSHRGLE